MTAVSLMFFAREFGMGLITEKKKYTFKNEKYAAKSPSNGDFLLYNVDVYTKISPKGEIVFLGEN